MTETATSKSLFATKTFWLNFITFLVMAVSGAMNLDFVQEHPQVVTYLSSAVAFLNIILRMLTDRPVTMTGGDVKTLKGKG